MKNKNIPGSRTEIKPIELKLDKLDAFDYHNFNNKYDSKDIK